MSEIVLTTLNAKFAHAAFGLRYLYANLAELASRAEILEFDISARPIDVVEALLAQNPRVVGLGVYIWNIDQATRVVSILRRVAPDVVLVLGGPEVSYEADELEICAQADFVISGEADLAFRDLCRQILNQSDGNPPAAILEPQAEVNAIENGIQIASDSVGIGLGLALASPQTQTGPRPRFISSGIPSLTEIAFPYALYTEADIQNRVIYVEASRGCPYECEFCLSSLDIPVRQFPLEQFLGEMHALWQRGVRQFKFVDRTFNLNLRVSQAILEFFLARISDDLFVHFEMIPDRLPDGLREVIRQFPPGVLQFEVGIQTFNIEVAALISRRQNYVQSEANLRWLREETGVHVHADLIIGLPGESLESFGLGFDRLVAIGPQEIQVGMLKRLRGTPLSRHDATWQMTYDSHAPYEILSTKLISYPEMQRLRRFARYWDLVANSGNFVHSTPLIWESESPFKGFLRFSDWLYRQGRQTHGIALKRLAELLFNFLVSEKQLDPAEAADAVWQDYQRGGKSDRPDFLRPYISNPGISREQIVAPRGKVRQERHRA